MRQVRGMEWQWLPLPILTSRDVVSFANRLSVEQRLHVIAHHQSVWRMRISHPTFPIRLRGVKRCEGLNFVWPYGNIPHQQYRRKATILHCDLPGECVHMLAEDFVTSPISRGKEDCLYG